MLSQCIRSCPPFLGIRSQRLTLLVKASPGTASALACWGGVPRSRVRAFVHELGHVLNLQHEGGSAEEAGVAPVVTVTVDEDGFTVTDSGPGIPGTTVEGALDFALRVSSREAYVAPDRGRQGNALKAIVAMPFCLDGERSRITIDAREIRHVIALGVVRIRQQPIVDHQRDVGLVKSGTKIALAWPDSASYKSPTPSPDSTRT